MAADAANAALENESANAGAATGIEGMMARASLTRPSPRSVDAAQHARLWDQYAQRIYRYCFRRTADHELAEDLTSIVFLEAWRCRSKLHLSPESQLPWLYGVASNVLRKQWRTQRRYRAALARLPEPRDERDLAQDAVERLDDHELMVRLLARLRSLPRIEQEVVSLCLWEELSPKEVAVALGVPEATVRTRLHRARRRLSVLAKANGVALLGGAPRVEGEGS
jgi:RNA polymerase sigma factor (sigma-70 family)